MLRWIMSALFVFQMYLAMLVLGIVFAPYALVARQGAFAACKTYCRWVFWTARWMVGIRTEVRGNVPEGEVIVAAKHQSFLDVMIIFFAVPRGKFIMKRAILWTPIIGLYAKRLGCVSVVRNRRGAALGKMVTDVAAQSKHPGQLIIYSQGTRVTPGDKKPYKVGSFVLYDETGQTVVPAAANTGLFWPRTGILRKPGVAVVEFLDPIEPGLDKRSFLTHLEDVVETSSDRLMAEAGFRPPAD